MKRAIVVLIFAAACNRGIPGYARVGEADRGRALLTQYGCTSCHVVPGVPGGGAVGPPLDRMGARLYLAGHIPNVPQNMVEWIRFPREAQPRTAMPDLGVSDRDARDIAAYLYTLR